MNLSFTDEQNLLRDSVSKFCGSDYDFETRMKSVNSDSGHNPEHWKLFAELGWLAIPFSEDLGGLDGGDVDQHRLRQVHLDLLKKELQATLTQQIISNVQGYVHYQNLHFSCAFQNHNLIHRILRRYPLKGFAHL